VVKGPEAIIAGPTTGYGGVINVISKAPQTQPVTEVIANYGSRNYYEVGLDVGRPVDADKSLLVRLVASKQGSGDTSVGFDGPHTEYIAPSATWRNKSWGSELTLQFEHQKKRRTPDPLVLTTDQTTLSDDLPALRLEPATDGTLIKSNVASLTFNQKLGEDWDLSIKYTDDDRKNQNDLISIVPGFYFGLSATTQMSLGFLSSLDYHSKATKVELKTERETGPLTHKMLFAFDQTRSTIDSTSQSNFVLGTDTATGVVTDLEPTLGALFGGIPGPLLRGGSRPRETGALFMDQIIWGDWIALVGWRHMTYAANNLIGTSAGEFKKSLPSLGVLYRVSSNLSLYANASKGFTPNSGNFSYSGGGVPPENARQFEYGAKAMSSDKKLSGSVAVFSIKQSNVAIADDSHGPFDCAGNPCYLSVPGVKSKGVELEVSGEVFTGLGLRANYTYTDKVADDPSQLGVPYARNLGSVWAIYRFRGDDLGGWWVSAGLQSRSARIGQTLNTIANPGRTRYDSSIGYDAKRWSFIGGVKNLTNKRMYPMLSGLLGQGQIGQQREFVLTARYSFD